MNANILATRSENNSNCFLCSITLEDYVINLPKTYNDYEIQREIVSNVYLDRLVNTVLHQRHIPPIVLVVEKKQYEKSGNILHIKSFKILDGLQRTHRLKIIWETLSFFSRAIVSNSDMVDWSAFKLSRQFSDPLAKISSDVDILRAIIRFHKDSPHIALKDCFVKNPQWFEVWTDLSPDQEVQKMLVLNAGHKAVKTRHQLELLFLNLLPLLTEADYKDFSLVREKELSSTAFSKSRVYGQFHFAHIIAALLSLSKRKPITTSTSLVQSLQEEDSFLSEDSEFIKVRFLNDFIAFLLKLDKTLGKQFQQQGTLWLGREIVLTGLFGAFGAFSEEYQVSAKETMERFLSLIEKGNGLLNLEEFELERNNLDLSKVNIGSVNKTAVFRATKEILESATPKKVSWKKYFHGGEA